MVIGFPQGWQHYAMGGAWIGIGVGLLFLATGLIGGMSTVFTSTWSFLSRVPFFQQPRFVESRAWRLVFAAGLVLGAAAWMLLGGQGPVQSTEVAPWRLFVGGCVAGYGARLANGCTSGHGICGLGSLQWPSLIAVLTFMATAVGTAQFVTRVLGG